MSVASSAESSFCAWQSIVSRRSSIRRSMRDRKSTRLNSSHQIISYAVFCLKKKKKHLHTSPQIRCHRSLSFPPGWQPSQSPRGDLTRLREVLLKLKHYSSTISTHRPLYHTYPRFPYCAVLLLTSASIHLFYYQHSTAHAPDLQSLHSVFFFLLYDYHPDLHSIPALLSFFFFK